MCGEDHENRPMSTEIEGEPDRSSPAAPPSVGIELLDYDQSPVDLDVGRSDLPQVSGRSSQLRSLVAVGGLLGFAFLALFLLSSSSTPPTAEPSPESAAPRVTTPVSTTTPTTSIPTEDEAQVALLESLERVDPELVAGLVVAWVDEDDQLQLQSLDEGALPVGRMADHDLPPLPQHIQLIGGENSTWLVDLLEPERSGKLSNTVRMVRLGAELDSYGFISENDAGPTDFFVGSLWGPSMNGTAQAPDSWTILPVPGTGIVVSSPTAQSSSIGGSGMEPLPRHVGRVVAATPDHVAGVTCDNRLQCVGAVSRWDGTDQQLFDANALNNEATVRISPDGRLLLSIIGRRWTVYDLEADSSFFMNGLPVDSTITWTPDSNALLWVAQGTLVAVEVETETSTIHKPRLVSPIGAVGPRLANSDLAVYDMGQVLEQAPAG